MRLRLVPYVCGSTHGRARSTKEVPTLCNHRRSVQAFPARHQMNGSSLVCDGYVFTIFWAHKVTPQVFLTLVFLLHCSTCLVPRSTKSWLYVWVVFALDPNKRLSTVGYDLPYISLHSAV